MKTIAVLCVVVLVGSCGADEDGQQQPGTEDRSGNPFKASMCPTTEPMMYGSVVEIGYNCVMTAVPRPNKLKGNDNKTMDDYRDFFREFCARQTVARSCLNETAVSMDVCKNDTLVKVFEIYRDLVEGILDIGCVEEGGKLAAVGYEMTEFFHLKQNTEPVKKCLDRFETMFNDLIKSEIDLASKFYILHKEMRTFVECVHAFDLKPSFKDALKHFTDVMVNGLKCVHPEDGTLVPCVTIDVGMVRTSNVCEVRAFGSGMSLYDVLEEDSGAHLMEFLNYDTDDVSDNDKIRHHVELECKYRQDLPYLFKKLLIVSEVCLNATEQAEFLLFRESIIDAYEVACHGDATRFADVMFEVFRVKRSGQGHAVWGCFDVAKATRNNVKDTQHGSGSKNMRFYHEVESFKTCLVDKLRGDRTSVDAATSLIDEMLKMVKCVDPETGTTVFCETLTNTTT